MATPDINEAKNSVTESTPSGNANTEIATCRYSSKPCSNPRAIKKTGDLHSFCEFHRLMANRNQRRCEQKRRTKRQFEKVVRRRSVQPPGFQMLMAMDGVPPPAQLDIKHKRRRSTSSVPSPTSSNGPQLIVAVPSINTSELEALLPLPETINPIAFHADIHTETELSLEPYSHPVELHDEDVQYLYMTVVDSTEADTRDSESTSLVDAIWTVLSYFTESSTDQNRGIGHAHHKVTDDLVPPLPSIAPLTTPNPAMTGQAGVAQSPERLESDITALQTTPLDEWRVAFMGVNHWRLAGAVMVLLVLSFVVANAIAFCFQVRRERRIRRKTIELAQFGPNHMGSDDKPTLQPVPVTILTGFLGAGKTTLLNRILQTPQLPYKIMVLENEIGTVSIDHALLDPSKTNEELQKDGIYVLQNGCMCCTARGAKGTKSELERILDYLLRVVNEQGFDYLVVETTGLADPGPIIETFLQLRASRFRLDAIVTMVDAHAIQRFYSPQRGTFDLPVELQRQFLYADVVALNKVDLVDATELQRARDAVTAFADGATTLECVQANVDLAQIVGIDTFDAVKFQGANGALDTDTGEHTKGITSVFLEVDAAVDVAKLTEWLNAVTAEYARAHILRIKGVLALSNSSRRCILQGVLDTYTIAPSAAWTPTDTRKCQLVVIGKYLDRGRLEDSFRQCIVRGNEGETGKKEDRGDTVPSFAASQEAKKTR